MVLIIRLKILKLQLILLSGCDFYDDRLKIRNISSEVVFVDVGPDTTLELEPNESFMLLGFRIDIDSTVMLIEPGSTRAWEFMAQNSKDKKLHIFFLSEDTLKKYDPHLIAKKQLYLKRMDVSIDSLKSNNWTVTYGQ